jgi:hypothetical protein
MHGDNDKKDVLETTENHITIKTKHYVELEKFTEYDVCLYTSTITVGVDV